MKLSSSRDCLVCEKCGTEGPKAETPQLMMRLTVKECGFGYIWTHGSYHTAHFFCSSCKTEFDCEVAK